MSQTEKDFARAFEDYLRIKGWRFAHFRPAQKQNGHWVTAMSGDAGFPDYVLVRNWRVVFVELKSEKGKPTIDQEVWLDALRATSAQVYVLKPSQWPLIESILA